MTEPEPTDVKIRRIIAERPELRDRQVARLARCGYTRVAQVRADLGQAEPPRPAGPGPEGHACPHCPRYLRTERGLRIHITVTHQGGMRAALPPIELPPDTPSVRSLVCECCGFEAANVQGLSNHITRRHLRQPSPPPVAEVAPPPVEEPRQPVIAARPEIVCANCQRPGSPASSRPEWCVACAASPELAAARANWATPPWRCECGRHFARSTREPEQCIKCTGEYDRDARRHRTGALFSHAAD